MNIFVLDNHPASAARAHVDKHVVKMPVESAQLLSTALRFYLDDAPDFLYRQSHINHPCCRWVMQSRSNAYWLWLLGMHLCEEYTWRYGRQHKTQDVLESISKAKLLDSIPEGSMTPFQLAMPDYCKCDDPVESYRTYYQCEKSELFRWTRRPVPDWL